MAKFLGAPYPITRHARGLLHTQSGIKQIKSDLLSLITTNRNERVMLPEFGVDLRRFLFEPNDPTLIAAVKAKIEQQLRRWEPRVVIEQIEITSAPEDRDLNFENTIGDRDHILLIRIMFFDPDQIEEIQELKLEVPLSGG